MAGAGVGKRVLAVTPTSVQQVDIIRVVVMLMVFPDLTGKHFVVVVALQLFSSSSSFYACVFSHCSYFYARHFLNDGDSHDVRGGCCAGQHSNYGALHFDVHINLLLES